MTRVLLIFVAILTPAIVSGFDCNRCQCSPSDWPTSAECFDQSLFAIPNSLPPTISKLGLDRNKIVSVDQTLR